MYLARLLARDALLLFFHFPGNTGSTPTGFEPIQTVLVGPGRQGCAGKLFRLVENHPKHTMPLGNFLTIFRCASTTDQVHFSMLTPHTISLCLDKALQEFAGTASNLFSYDCVEGSSMRLEHVTVNPFPRFLRTVSKAATGSVANIIIRRTSSILFRLSPVLRTKASVSLYTC